MVVRDIRFNEALLPPEIHCAGPNAGPGTLLCPPPGGFSFTARLAYAVAVADTEVACRSALDAAAKALDVEADEAPAAP
jgi:hypothetical protein